MDRDQHIAQKVGGSETIDMSQETKTGYRQVSPEVDIPVRSSHALIHVSLVFFRHFSHHDTFYSQLSWVGLYADLFVYPRLPLRVSASDLRARMLPYPSAPAARTL